MTNERKIIQQVVYQDVVRLGPRASRRHLTHLISTGRNGRSTGRPSLPCTPGLIKDTCPQFLLLTKDTCTRFPPLSKDNCTQFFLLTKDTCTQFLLLTKDTCPRFSLNSLKNHRTGD